MENIEKFTTRFQRLKDHAITISETTDEKQKQTGFKNLLKQIKTEYPDLIIPQIEAINLDVSIEDVDNVIYSEDYRHIKVLFHNFYDEICIYEQDTPEQEQERKAKLKKYELYDTILPIEVNPHPDQIYTKHGVYRIYFTYKDSALFNLLLDVKRGGNVSGNELYLACNLLILYKAIENDLEAINEVLALMGIDTNENASTIKENDEYSSELIKLFKGHKELISELFGKSDDDIAKQIKKWAKEKDNSGKSMIENPDNRLRSAFARELRKAGIITLSFEGIRKKF